MNGGPRILVAIVLALLCLAGCRGGETDPPAGPVAPPVEATFERGPVRVVQRVSSDAITVGDKLVVELEVTAAAGVDVTMPLIESTLSDFAVRSADTPPPLIDADGGRSWRHRYVLDTFAAGDVELPVLAVTFDDRRDPGGAVAGEIMTDSVAITVASALSEGDDTPLADVEDMVGVPLPMEIPWATIIAVAALVAVGLIGAVVAVRRRGRRHLAPPPPPIPAHIWARRALDALEAEGLVERGAMLPFYDRLSGIVRGYVERRWGLHAPERTTDEFLREMAGSSVLAPGHQALLVGFLRAADLVKFARFEPEADEGRRALAAARGLVDETSPAVREPAA